MGDCGQDAARASSAAERWKGSIRTPTGGGAALGTQLVISIPEAAADWDANSSRPTQLPVC